MNHPGVGVLGDLGDDDRNHGMGIVIEYAGRTGKPQWVAPNAFHWNYLRFGKKETAAESDQTIDMTFVKRNAEAHGFNQWSINDESFLMDKTSRCFTSGKEGATVFGCAMPATTSIRFIFIGTVLNSQNLQAERLQA